MAITDESINDMFLEETALRRYQARAAVDILEDATELSARAMRHLRADYPDMFQRIAMEPVAQLMRAQ